MSGSVLSKQRIWTARGALVFHLVAHFIVIAGAAAQTDTAFTDDPLVPGVTPVRAVHFRELRTRIDALRGRVGLPAFPWTDRTLTPGGTPVRHVHVTDMREALAAAYEAAGRPAPAYGARVAAGTPIRASDVTELRIAVIALEAAPRTSVSLSAAPNPVAEGSAVTVTAALSAALQEDLTVPLTITAGTAEPGDYGSLAGITIAAGRTAGTGAVTTARDADTDDETFTVALGPLPPSVTAGSPSSVEVTIEDGDAVDGGVLDRAALVALYEATTGPNWRDNRNWLSDAPIGEWSGVDVGQNGRVSRLSLPRNGLTGSIPPELGSLVSLEWLELWGNDLTGPIPLELGSLASLEWLDLFSNDLTGPIPPELGQLTRVEWLNLEFNDLTGPIPPELGSLASLEWLLLGGNGLTGSIPPELGNLTRVTGLSLSPNDLTGPIPPEIANLQNLETLIVPAGVCVPADLLDWAVGQGVSAYPCESDDGRLLPSALMREDGNGLSLALPDDLREPSAVIVSDPSVVAASVADGWLELVPRGRGSADVQVVPSGGGEPASARVVVRAAVGTFGIDIVMDRPAPLTYEEGLMRGADWWSAVLDGTEWPDRRPTCFNERATALADELLIHAWVDSETDAAGYADVCFRESGKQGGLDLDPGGRRRRGGAAERQSVFGAA